MLQLMLVRYFLISDEDFYKILDLKNDDNLDLNTFRFSNGERAIKYLVEEINMNNGKISDTFDICIIKITHECWGEASPYHMIRYKYKNEEEQFEDFFNTF